MVHYPDLNHAMHTADIRFSFLLNEGMRAATVTAPHREQPHRAADGGNVKLCKQPDWRDKMVLFNQSIVTSLSAKEWRGKVKQGTILYKL